MNFIEPSLNAIAGKLEMITATHQPLWGQMSAQRMIEHLSDTIILSKGNHTIQLAIPEDKVERAQQFLLSEHPMPKDFNVSFATPEMSIRNNSIEEALDEFKNAWRSFEEFFSGHKGTTLHPYFGNLNYELWLRMHSKHITHHLAQFGINV